MSKKVWTTYGVELPPSVIAIIEAAGGTDPNRGGMPFAMTSIVGALPWIMVAMHEKVPAADYRRMLRQLKANMEQTWNIASAADPAKAFTDAYEHAKRQM